MENEIKLRDYFAAKVLEGIYSNNEMYIAICKDKKTFTRNKDDTTDDYVAQLCYEMANAMLKERMKINDK